MSVVAKILIVVNLLLAVVFLGASATFLGRQENYKAQLATLKQNTDLQIRDLTSDRDRERTRAGQLEREKSNVDATLATLQAQITQKELDYAQISKNFTDLQVEHTKLVAAIDDLKGQLRDLTAANERLNEEKETAARDKRTAIDAQNAAVAEQHRLESQIEDHMTAIEDLNKQIAQLSDQLESANMVVAAYERQVGPIGKPAPELTAKVLGANAEHNIVMISLGRDDGVKAGFTFSVYRGNEYVGRVVIDHVEKDYASGYSVKELEKMPIQAGDDATTRF